jgi:hypothetical protein
MTRPSWPAYLVSVLLAGAVGLLIGRTTEHRSSSTISEHSASTTSEHSLSPTSEQRLSQPTATAVSITTTSRASTSSSLVAGSDNADECAGKLAQVQAQLESEHHQRREAEGNPISAPPEILPRLKQESLLQAASAAFRQSRVPGRVETIDCGEYPCIVYGRIVGDEDLIERVERARAFAPSADDVLTLLSWAATDEAAQSAGHTRETRPERMLIAIAIYSQDDRARYGDAIDRRVRVRTADLWNALRPDDEE